MQYRCSIQTSFTWWLQELQRHMATERYRTRSHKLQAPRWPRHLQYLFLQSYTEFSRQSACWVRLTELGTLFKKRENLIVMNELLKKHSPRDSPYDMTQQHCSLHSERLGCNTAFTHQPQDMHQTQELTIVRAATAAQPQLYDEKCYSHLINFQHQVSLLEQSFPSRNMHQ